MRAIPAGSRVALDTMILIYALEHHPVLGQAADHVLQRVQSGDLHGLGSTLIFAEFLPTVFARFDAATAKAARSALSALSVTYVPVSEEIAAEGARLRAVYGLRTPDALHVATALVSGADVLVTNDRRLERLRAERLVIVQIGDTGQP